MKCIIQVESESESNVVRFIVGLYMESESPPTPYNCLPRIEIGIRLGKVTRNRNQPKRNQA